MPKGFWMDRLVAALLLMLGAEHSKSLYAKESSPNELMAIAFAQTPKPSWYFARFRFLFS